MAGGARRGGFSLAELMIAFAVLAMGLLVIGAALPIGVRYTQQGVELDLGEAAAEHALDLIEQNVMVVHKCSANRCGVLFQPRDPNSGEYRPDHEPLIKVRPLYTQNVRADGADRPVILADTPMRAVRAFVGNDTRECGSVDTVGAAMACVAQVYPPVPITLANGDPYLPADYSPGSPGQWNVTSDSAEVVKAMDRRVAWTAFYRRVDYSTGGDPTLYEFIVVVTRRPSLRHRYPMQKVAGVSAARATVGSHDWGWGQAATVAKYDGTDTLVPVPWLVTFSEPLPEPELGYVDDDPKPGSEKFPMIFKISGGIEDGLFPVGAVFLPARNDDDPTGGPAVKVGLSPDAPSACPIYKVIERPDEFTVVVENNGYYPKEEGANRPPSPEQWPVWVIPPSFAELSGNDPVFEQASPIVAVSRRYVRLHEVP